MTKQQKPFDEMSSDELYGKSADAQQMTPNNGMGATNPYQMGGPNAQQMTPNNGTNAQSQYQPTAGYGATMPQTPGVTIINQAGSQPNFAGMTGQASQMQMGSLGKSQQPVNSQVEQFGSQNKAAVMDKYQQQSDTKTAAKSSGKDRQADDQFSL